MIPNRRLLATVCALGLSGVLAAQAPDRPAPKKFVLSIESIARQSRSWMGSSPSGIQWLPDGKSITFNWNPELKDQGEQYVMPAAGGTPRRVPEDQRRLLPTGGDYNKERTQVVYERFGDLYLHDVRTGDSRRLTETEAAESRPRFAPDGKSFTFERDQNLHSWTVDTATIRQITNFKTGKDPEEKPKLTKMQDYLEKQQLDLFDILKKQENDEKERKARDKAERGPQPQATYLKDGQRAANFQLSGDGKYVTFILTEPGDSTKAKVVEMPKYVTKSGYVESEKLTLGTQSRTKVGDPILGFKLGIVDTSTGKVVYADHGQGERSVNFNPASWSTDGSKVFAWAGSTDQRDAWLLALDPATGKTRTLLADHDDAWLLGFRDGQGPGDMASGWMPDNQTIYFMTERTGYRHLYTVPSAGGEPRALTSGKFEVFAPRITRDGSRWYFVSSEVHPGERQLYTMPASGGTPTRLTKESGWYDYYLSPDESQIALSYGNGTTPAELYVAPAPAAAGGGFTSDPTRLTSSTTEEFRSYAWTPTEIVTFKDQDGVEIYGELVKPKTPHPLRPAVIYVHGAGYAQGVYRRWSDEGMFFKFLAENGYHVLNIDYRGSAGYGRAFGRDVYRSMGDKDVTSAVAAADYLAKQHKIDRRRIGIYGGSYGGFFTLMALFKHPGVFAAGAALYPVTDWAHYNHGYTSRILNLAWEDDEAYRRSSPIYFANGLRDRLLILHGVVDSNVHFQDTVRLVQRLIELKKTGWDLAIYPVESHGWQQESSRLDSYRRIYGLFESALKAPAPAGGSRATTTSGGQ